MPVKFPQPVKFQSCTRWPLSALEEYEAACLGKPAPSTRPPESERYLSVRQVARRLGVSVPTVWRWASGNTASSTPNQATS